VISDTAGFSPASFSASPSGGNLQGVSGGGSSSGPIYTYAASYDGVGNVTGYTDSVMGTWSFGYDTLNRLLSGQNTGTTSTSRQYAGQNLCWAYDSFGNRTAQSQQSAACSTSTMAQFASTWCASPKYSRPSFSWISGLAQVAETISLLTVRTLRFLGRIEFGEAQVVKD
jgi:YD repeat-containing protein